MMVRTAVTAFLGLVGLIFIISYPEKVVDILQMIVDSAAHMAQSLKDLNVKKAG